MFFLVVGVRSHSRGIGEGGYEIRDCPRCRTQRRFEKKSRRPYLELFLLPIFPVGKGYMVLACRSCGFEHPEPLRKREQEIYCVHCGRPIATAGGRRSGLFRCPNCASHFKLLE